MNCDGEGPHAGRQVRLLPTGSDGNAILCRACYAREMNFRRERNQELDKSCQFDIPHWSSLKIYGEEVEP